MNREIYFILKNFLLWRIMVFVPILVGAMFISERLGYVSLISPFANFDGVHYLSIAQGGYTTQAAFFPLYPLLINLFGKALGGNYFLSGFLISNVTFLLSLVLLFKLVKKDFSSSVAIWTNIFILVFPTSFFFGSIYSESLFLFLLLSTFWFARQKKWVLASLTGALLSATRLVGVLVLPALAYEFYKANRPLKTVSLKASWEKLKEGLYLLIVPLGLLVYSYYNFLRWGNAFYFIKAHGELANSRSVDKIILFPRTLYRYFKIFLSLPLNQFEWWVAVLEVAVFIGGAFLIYLAYKRKVRMSYLIFSILAFIIPISSGTFSGLPRYISLLFPIYIALAMIKSIKIKVILSALFVTLEIFLLMYFASGYFVA